MAYFSKEMERLAKAGFPREQYDLARCYESGLGIKLNEKAAVKWYENAANGGHPGAKVRLAIDHLSRRDYRDTNLRRAYQYLTEARAAGYNAAEIDRLISTIPAEYRK